MDYTKYEVARLIGARALQLSSGAPPMMKIESSLTFIQIAELEFEKKILPLVVLREKIHN